MQHDVAVNDYESSDCCLFDMKDAYVDYFALEWRLVRARFSSRSINLIVCVLTDAITNSHSLNASPAEMFDMDEATKDFEYQFPQFAKWGWGPSVQAEKWNGRHAMFGWLFICATAYCKGHGLIPNPEQALDFKEWGTLATISGKNTITNERAIILIANAHFFAVSLLATICPLPFSDPLLIDPTSPMYEKTKEQNESGYGYLPALKFGVTEEAEIINGRLAMVGIAALIFATALEQKPVSDSCHN